MNAQAVQFRLKTLPWAILARLKRQKCHGHKDLMIYLQDKCALEIGGPSAVFRWNQLVPVYPLLATLDVSNFALHTLWSKQSDADSYHRPIRKQFTAEATSLTAVPNESYDLVLASHVLEHIANPVQALIEWRRVLRPGGSVLAILPHPVGTFDHRRPITTLDHLLRDHAEGRGEHDLTHLDEILALHDLALDLPAGTLEQFRQRCLRNFEIRAMHHHVFSPERLVELLSEVDMSVRYLSVERPCHIIVLASKIGVEGPCRSADNSEIRQQNRLFLESRAPWRRHDPFGWASDKKRASHRSLRGPR
jgi:SAM-dependent methyltransferase